MKTPHPDRPQAGNAAFWQSGPEGLQTLHVAGIPLAYRDAGQGPTVLLLHSAGASHRQWRGLIDLLALRFRVIAPDLPGHGFTPPLPNPARRNREGNAELIAALVAHIGEPFHLVGHSYGGAVALHTALAWQDRLLSLTVAEPSAFELLRQAGEHTAWAEIEDVARRHVALARQGELDWAADVFMGYWIGAEAWAAMPRERREAVRATMDTIADGWPDIYTAATPLAAYRNLTVPTLLLRGARTSYAANRVVEVLHHNLPRHELVEIEDAGHMAPLTHAVPFNALVATFLERHTGTAPRTARAVA